jgi:uncharacterized membrane protein
MTSHGLPDRIGNHKKAHQKMRANCHKIMYDKCSRAANGGKYMDWLEQAVHTVAEAGILLVQSAGILVVLLTAVKGVIGYFRKDPHIRLKLAQGITLGLDFKLGGEVLRTVIVREWSELAILGAIILMRGLLTLLLNWEIKNEEARFGKSAEPVKGNKTDGISSGADH